MRFTATDFMNVLTLCTQIEKLDIPVEKKVSVLEEIYNATPQGGPALQYKTTAEVICAEVRRRIDKLASGLNGEKEVSKGAPKAA